MACHPITSERFIEDRAQIRNSRDGFTLIELLVVLAILGVLASLLLPALTRVKTKAQNAVCLNNLAHLGKATHEYLADSSDKFFSAVISNYYALDNWVGNACNSNFNVPRIMTGFDITPEMKPLKHYAEIKTAACPGDTKYFGMGAFQVTGTSYVSSHYPALTDLKPKMIATLSSETRQFSSVKSPAVLVEASEFFASAYVQNLSLSALSGDNYSAIRFHGNTNKFNVLFVDGHAGNITLNMGQVEGRDFTYDDK